MMTPPSWWAPAMLGAAMAFRGLEKYFLILILLKKNSPFYRSPFYCLRVVVLVVITLVIIGAIIVWLTSDDCYDDDDEDCD